MSAVVALILMPAKDRGSACLDGAHDSPIIAGQPMGFSIRRAVLTEYVRNFKATRCSHSISGLRSLVGSIEGTCNLCQIQPTDMQIDSGCCRGSMAKKKLDMVETRSRFNEMGGKAVPQSMYAYRLCDASTLFCSAKDRLYRI